MFMPTDGARRQVVHRIVAGLALALCAHCGASGGGGSSNAAPSCAELCARLAAGGCPNPNPSCEARCAREEARSPATCSVSRTLALNCRAAAAVVCDAAGQPDTPSCATSTQAYEACRANPPPPMPMPQPPSAATCEAVCARLNATCSRSDARCTTSCDQAAAQAAARCAAEFRASLACFARATVGCSTSGSPRPEGCEAATSALQRCRE